MSDSNSNEAARRLEPLPDTKRQLFLFSGNICAFPDCSHQIMNKHGILVGEICHIEAALKDGQRFNSSQNNEERRSVNNLMLMCPEHHVVTNDVVKYPVHRLKQIKADHEKKVLEFIEGMTLRIYDVTKTDVPKYARTLSKIRQQWNSTLTPDEIADCIAEVNSLLDKFRRVPKAARQLFVIAVDRGRKSGPKYVVLFNDLSAACSVSGEDLHKYWLLLDHHDLVFDAGEDEYGQKLWGLAPLKSGWAIWTDLKALAATGHATLEELIVDLNFSLLD